MFSSFFVCGYFLIFSIIGKIEVLGTTCVIQKPRLCASTLHVAVLHFSNVCFLWIVFTEVNNLTPALQRWRLQSGQWGKAWTPWNLSEHVAMVASVYNWKVPTTLRIQRARKMPGPGNLNFLKCQKLHYHCIYYISMQQHVWNQISMARRLAHRQKMLTGRWICYCFFTKYPNLKKN